MEKRNRGWTKITGDVEMSCLEVFAFEIFVSLSFLVSVLQSLNYIRSDFGLPGNSTRKVLLWSPMQKVHYNNVTIILCTINDLQKVNLGHFLIYWNYCGRLVTPSGRFKC